ncbi:hypothetical protein TD95_002659 [Thielaviopsis punctulata]|uniref:WSC domain-containing protein n=1 Tax=Thielaviopsis punctulata TaxID=72032 RepID=A0A0F4ZJ79_9PEZI|nr:hypothetical protein TD95_002659 [Thielaviopsis punctulata]
MLVFTALHQWLATLLFVSLFANSAQALAARDDSLSIYNASSTYIYKGCYNETVQLPGAGGVRALSGGKSEELMGTMTVPLCLSYCMDDGYEFAGLEYSRECWCSHYLSSLSVKLNDSACNDACDGAKDVACGGALKLTLYEKTKSNAPGKAIASLTAVGFALLVLLF